MISAHAAREIASLPDEMEELNRLVTTAAKAKKPGVWVKTPSELAIKKLKRLGFEITIGSNNWCSKKDKVCLWWGN